ncbi:hypothetical protein [Cryobacterium sp. AP23]
METILDRLASETSAAVVLIEIPILGEVRVIAENCRVDEYNAAHHSIWRSRGLPVLPLYERMLGALPPGATATPFDVTKNAMYSSAIARLVLRRPWERISARRNLTLLTDHVHPNDTGATIISDLITHFIGHRRLDPHSSASP